MRTIKVDYGQVYEETAKHTGTIASDVIERVEVEYRRMLEELFQGADGAANGALMDAIDLHRKKTAEAAGCVVKLLKFISDSARQLEVAEQQMVRAFTMQTGRNGGQVW